MRDRPPIGEFQLDALQRAMDDQRRDLGLTWSAVVRQINGTFRDVIGARPMQVSTVRDVGHRSIAEGDGVLQMLLWLDRSPESFLPDDPGHDEGRCRLPVVGPAQVLRWDTAALQSATKARAADRDLTWAEVARATGCSLAMVTGLARAKRVSVPPVMRLVQWLEQPAVTFTRAATR